MSISVLSSWFYFSIKLLWPIHWLFAYSLISARALNVPPSQIVSLIWTLSQKILLLGNIFNGTLFLLALLSICFHVKNKEAGLLYILQYAG
jgi:hypothetical protein